MLLDVLVHFLPWLGHIRVREIEEVVNTFPLLVLFGLTIERAHVWKSFIPPAFVDLFSDLISPFSSYPQGRAKRISAQCFATICIFSYGLVFSPGLVGTLHE